MVAERFFSERLIQEFLNIGQGLRLNICNNHGRRNFNAMLSQFGFSLGQLLRGLGSFVDGNAALSELFEQSGEKVHKGDQPLLPMFRSECRFNIESRSTITRSLDMCPSGYRPDSNLQQGRFVAALQSMPNGGLEMAGQELLSIQREGDPESETLQDMLFALPARELLLDLREMPRPTVGCVVLQLCHRSQVPLQMMKKQCLHRLSSQMKEKLRDQFLDTVLYVEDRFRDPNWTRQAARKLGVLVAPSVAPALLATRPQAQRRLAHFSACLVSGVWAVMAAAAYTLGLAMPYFPLCSSSPASSPRPRKRKYQIQVPVDDVEFSQDSIGERFTCGRQYKYVTVKVHPRHSRNNRRLWCLKEYQKLRRREDKDFTVKVRLDASFSDFLSESPAVTPRMRS
ncbi:hypothetical protein AK812_SmicGene26440 [Symbiodinium microadriaticum]|uniref:Uncharacterized protein n=1 Tax=Symbiodinium microadriaticum TaxID=2951 RepID=A0A1Q9D9H9_SYMMI|nr:hypothetical protein AK812_SmicGene26440 [Symbiodinium microadriaticum]